VSLCDTCSNPGRCCTGFTLSAPSDVPDTALEALVKMASALTWETAEGRSMASWQAPFMPASSDARVMLGLPFMPLWKRSDGVWYYWCPRLVEGRCSDYENRPALCAAMVPGQGPLCCMSQPGPSFDPAYPSDIVPVDRDA
jgi:Fe-S-cluster containining protein